MVLNGAFRAEVPPESPHVSMSHELKTPGAFRFRGLEW
jgi:hypothetical protein